MVQFNSLIFMMFLVLMFGLNWLSISRPALRTMLLLIGSYTFYGFGAGWLVVLLLVSTLTDYFVAMLIAKSESQSKRRMLLVLSIVVNLSMLGYFKYAGFFVETLAAGLQSFGFVIPAWKLEIVLPIGISFYTFQTMSYTIDVYRRVFEPIRRWQDFALYVSFFPQLVAGPIVRASQFFVQLSRNQIPTIEGVRSGIALVVTGIFKKVVIADYLAIYADSSFKYPLASSSAELWIGFYAFAFQIYFDFSGYTDVARGTGRMLGFELPENFHKPYAATSITDFWRRWHITLSTWLRDYLYIPLGGNRLGLFRTCRNILITMILGGLWHGAALTYVIWGFGHGVLLVLERLRSKIFILRRQYVGLRLCMQRLITFHMVCMLWIVFRVPNFSTAREFLTAMGRYVPGALTHGLLLAVFMMAIALLLQWTNFGERVKQYFGRMPDVVRGGCYACAAVLIGVFSSGSSTPFIYFQF